MKINRISYGDVNLTLSAADCRRLARALDRAAAETITPDGEHIETLAAAFHALAIAAYAQYELTPAGHAMHQTDLVETGLLNPRGEYHVQ
jgi:hypothetical protein